MTRQLSWLDRACIVVLGLDWLVFGSLHFIGHEFAVREVPAFFDPYRSLVVWVSGAAEVIVGILVLIPRTRRLAALGSLAILVAISPAILHITFVDDAYLRFAELNVWFRRIMIPHALLMAFFSFRAWKVSSPTAP